MKEVEDAVWGMETVTPVHQTFTALNNGGIILGAYDGEKMIGFLYSFPGFDGSKAYVCSHMLGLLPDYRRMGLGEKMKRKQAEIAKEKGFEMITWTFDPLESVNAYLNIHKLGAIGARFAPHYYGDLQDELNGGLTSDRIHIEWDLTSTGEKGVSRLVPEQMLLTHAEDGSPQRTEAFHRMANEQEMWFMAIPPNFQHLKKENFALAKAWRKETSHIFQILFNQGYQAIDIIRDEQKIRYYYVFAKSKENINEYTD